MVHDDPEKGVEVGERALEEADQDAAPLEEGRVSKLMVGQGDNCVLVKLFSGTYPAQCVL